MSYSSEVCFLRNKEVKNLLNYLKNNVNTFVYGKYGIGKTALVKQVIEKYNAKIGQAVYIDGLLYQTANAILREIHASLNSFIASKSNYDLTKRLKKKIEKQRCTVFIDHFKNIKTPENILNILLSLNVCVCLIDESLNSYQKLRVTQRSKIANIIKISEYSQEQVWAILQEKANLLEIPVSDQTLSVIVDNVDSNLTLALNFLSSLSTEKDEKQIVYLLSILKKTSQPPIRKDESIILTILQDHEILPSGALYKLYREQIDYPRSKRSFRNFMQNLTRKNLVNSIGIKRGRKYKLKRGIK